MGATRDLIAALVAGGMDAADAAGLVARAAVEMTAMVTRKSPGATRQQRYRERHKASQSVTNVTEQEASPSVTKRNEASQSNAASLSIEESKKGNKREGRASQLPEGWRPDQKHWDEAIAILGSLDRAEKELRKFQLHAADKGRLAKNWNAAWVKWALQAVEYGARNGNGSSDHRTNTPAGRATAREAQHVASMAGAARKYLEAGKSTGPEGGISDSPGFAEILDADPGTENAH